MKKCVVGMLLKLKSIINEKADFTNKLNNKKVRGQNFVKTEVSIMTWKPVIIA